MGCWNATCSLTHLPIMPGQDVVELTAATGGASYKTSSMSLSTPLLFGLPQKGTYDDYGGTENYSNESYREFQQKALEENGFYRSLRLKASYGSTSEIWLACHSQTLWSCTEDIAPLFRHLDGVTLPYLHKNKYSSSEQDSLRYKKVTESLSKLGRSLDKEFPAGLDVSENDFNERLQSVFESCFGEPNAYLAYSLLKNKGLTTGFTPLLMHKSAYDSLVARFGKNKLHLRDSTAKQPTVRQFLSDTLDEFLSKISEGEKKSLEIQEKLREASKDKEMTEEEKEDLEQTLDYLSCRLFGVELSTGRFAYLKALSIPWGSTETLISSNFWGARTVSQVMEVYPREDLLDFFVFQWAIHSLRVPFKAYQGGSQQREVLLPANMFKDTLIKIKEDGYLRSDFYGHL